MSIIYNEKEVKEHIKKGYHIMFLDTPKRCDEVNKMGEKGGNVYATTILGGLKNKNLTKKDLLFLKDVGVILLECFDYGKLIDLLQDIAYINMLRA